MQKIHSRGPGSGRGTATKGHFQNTICDDCSETQTQSWVQLFQTDFCALVPKNMFFCEAKEDLPKLSGKKKKKKRKRALLYVASFVPFFSGTSLFPPQGQVLAAR